MLLYGFLIAAAFVSGLIDAVAGGGGLITVPALLAAGFPAQLALGTNKVQAIVGTSCALANFHRNDHVVWRIAFAGIPFSLAGSVVGAKLALVLPAGVLARMIIVLLPPAAAVLFFSKALLREVAPRETHAALFWLATILYCLAIGFYDGFFGPGTGTFLILALVLFSRLSLVDASATAKTFNLASNIAAGVTFIAAGSVDYRAGAAMAVANAAGNYLGSHHAMKRGDAFVRKILFIALAILFVYLVIKYYGTR